MTRWISSVIGIKAAQTGHLVLSTLHTNDAPTTLTRLMNMGVAPFNIAASVLLITAQRLARRLCDVCKQPAVVPDEAMLKAGFHEPSELDGSWKPYRAVGCAACSAPIRPRKSAWRGCWHWPRRCGLDSAAPRSPEPLRAGSPWTMRL